MTKPGTDAEVLLLGNLANDSITTTIKSMGSSYIQKIMHSSPGNWERIIELLEKDSSEIACVLVKLTEQDFYLSVTPSYKDLFNRICKLLESHKHILFVYAGIFSLDLPLEDEKLRAFWATKEREIKEEQERHLWPEMVDNSIYKGYTGSYEEFLSDLKQRVSQLQSTGLRIAPYHTLVELNVSAQEFIQEAFRGLLMRIYIPNDRLWSGEIDKLLNLFVDYLRRVGDYPVMLDQNRTERGIIYGFYSADNEVTKEQISGLLEEFSIFLKVCAENPAKASELLDISNISNKELHSIITKYSKEARRLLIDIQYEKESKLLAIHHRLQSEVLDTLSVNERRNALMMIDESLRERSEASSGMLNMTDLIGQGNTIIQSQTIHINNPQFISKVNGIIAQEINGSIEYTELDERIIDLFKQYTTQFEFLELKSSLDELKDESAPYPQRTTARQKIQGFLSKHSGTIGKSALTILEKYIEHLLTGK